MPFGEGFTNDGSGRPATSGPFSADDQYVDRGLQPADGIAQAHVLCDLVRYVVFDDEKVHVAARVGLPSGMGAEEDDLGRRARLGGEGTCGLADFCLGDQRPRR